MISTDTFKSFMASVSNAAGLNELVPNEDGLLLLNANGIEMGIQLIAEADKVFLFTEIGVVPEYVQATFLRTILQENIGGRKTGGGWFALMPTTNLLVYQRLWDFHPEHVHDFTKLMTDILDFSELWQGRLKQEFAEDVTADPSNEFIPPVQIIRG